MKILLLLAPLWVGCSATRSAVKAELPALSDSEYAEHLQRAANHWERREKREDAEAALTTWERAAAGRRADSDLLTKLARASYFYADAHLFFDGETAKQRYLKVLERGAHWAELALRAGNPEIQRRMANGGSVVSVLDAIDRSSVAALYWHGINLYQIANSQGFVPLAIASPRIKKMMERCIELDEGYFYAGAHLFLAVFYARAPLVAGGDMAKSTEHFEQLRRLAPDYLAGRVMWAEFWATKKEDRDGFMRELKGVLERPDDALPEAIPENRAEKERAKRLLSRADQLLR
jgi:hypothetical protein